MKSSALREQGFTLVEVIISIAILSLASVVILRLFIASTDLNTDSRHRDIASVLATNCIEQIKLFDSLSDMSNDMDGFVQLDNYYSQTTLLDHDFERTLSDSAVYQLDCSLASTPTTGLYDIIVVVTELDTSEELTHYTSSHYFKSSVKEVQANVE